MFADDLILIIKGNKLQLNQKLNSINEIIIQFGLKPNKEKTVISKDLKKIKYLGIYLDKISHIVYNLKKDKETFNNCKQLFNNNSLNNNLKIRLFKSFILSQLTYGLEIFNYEIKTLNSKNSWINTTITEISKINRNTPILIYKTEFKIENMALDDTPQKYFTILKNQDSLFKTQKYLSYPSSSTILKFTTFTNSLNRYYYVINKNSNKFCPLCLKYKQKEVIENIDHFLWVCPSYENNRLIFLNKLNEKNLYELILNNNSLFLFSLVNNREIYDFALKFLKGNQV
ncbi:hypothetical protein M0812_28912 [Anaeramoeba flamelloides]|uniref:Reverse transcriptase domain-containing protein n=1 Tax=Anaeramoeba flamelloides TaxID=1746091 RepID=A0AAV7YC39_9EUKA|nr:hypothetical protein M0812_28912 [Anaeramoeba flamelloides]